ncbi:MAG: DUF1573 domain-containing protein [Planctomycetota bacterium]|nr:MAG: DUF1573 domain-containing protein [Planctomycetota bacterium]
MFPEPFRGPQAAEAGARPRLIVDSRAHNFGSVERYSTVKHAFRFTNAGTGPLTLKAGSTTCTACTIASVSRAEVPPGESAEVEVAYTPSGSEPFRQTAVVHTNDPENPRVELDIRGLVSSRYSVSPDKVVLSSVPAGDSARGELKAYYYLDGPFEIADYKFTGTSHPSHFDAEVESIPSDQLPARATKGYRVWVTLKPGLPLGAFRQTIRLTLEMGESADRVDFPVPIEGTIVSDLSIVGADWRSSSSVLNLGDVQSQKGTTRKLTLLARGPARNDVRYDVKTVDPPYIELKLGESEPLSDAVNRIPIEITIPPGQQPAIHLGTDQGDYGLIVLGIKNHPDVKEIRINLKFVIED